MVGRRRRWHDQRVLALAQSQGVADPEVAVRSLCAALIDETGLATPPFTAEVLASFRDVVAIRRKTMREAGRLIPLDQGFEIEVNSGHVAGKQNFSINHEICHSFFAEYGQTRVMVDKDTGTFNAKVEEEYLCDIGASALLFEPRWFQPLASKLGATGAAIFELAKSFGGSLEATARAWCDLDLCPCAVIFWEKTLKPSQNGLLLQETLPGLESIKEDLLVPRVRLSWHSAGFQRFGYFPKWKSAEKGGHVYACLDSGQPEAGLENFVLGTSDQHLWTDNFYVPYRKEGVLCPRVMSVVTAAGIQTLAK